jgi:hypothetical protein
VILYQLSPSQLLPFSHEDGHSIFLRSFGRPNYESTRRHIPMEHRHFCRREKPKSPHFSLQKCSSFIHQENFRFFFIFTINYVFVSDRQTMCEIGPEQGLFPNPVIDLAIRMTSDTAEKPVTSSSLLIDVWLHECCST